ncbi:hypothetical protein KKF61_01505, partial [Patescibacteria group bacterium]|nr:hypothetical protein [Patescibacteria group bacterium]
MQTLFFYDKPFKIAFWLIVIIESLSFLSHTYSVVNQVLFFTIIAATLIISFWKLEYGFWIICTELFISSFGYLFYFDAFDFRFSIRLGIFFVIFLAWLIKAVHTKQWQFYRSRLRWPFVALLAVLAWGIVNGIINGNPLKDVFFDANAYLYFGIIFVAFSVLNTWSKINTLIQLLFASITAMAIKTIFLLFYFAHQADINSIRLLYTWVRDTRVGEIAPVAQNYYRIFFQGHIWSLFSLILL